MTGQRNRDGVPPVNPAAADRLTQLVGRLGDRRSPAQVVVGVATTDGEFEWVGAGGRGPGNETMAPEVPYWIASVTKLFTASTVLRLHEREEIDLDESIAAYLPSGLTAGLHQTDDVDRTSDITVRHLLSHTSGLADYWDHFDGRSLYKRLSDGEDVSWTLEEAVAAARASGPRFPPQDLGSARQKAYYSDTNYQLLIAILEAITGDGFARILERELFEPLGLLHTYLPGCSEPLAPTPPAVGVFDKDELLDIPDAVASSLDLISTVGDNLRFQRALVTGEVFDRPGTYEVMHERWNRIYYPLRYGLGTMKYKIGRLYAPGSQSLTLVGHSGVNGSWLFHSAELGVVVAGTVNQIRGRSKPFRLMPRVLRACFAD